MQTSQNIQFECITEFEYLSRSSDSVDNTVISNDDPTPCLGRTVPKSRSRSRSRSQSQSQLQNNTTFKSCDMNTHRSVNINKVYDDRGGNYDVCNNCNNHDKHSDKQIEFDHNISNTDHSRYKQCNTCNLPKKM